MAEIKFAGVTFDSLREALGMLFFYYEGMQREEFDEKLKFVVPMQHNFENPLKPGSNDTYIQYWIDSDERMTLDRYESPNLNTNHKVAYCTVRFIGARAEMWAKTMHHLRKNKRCDTIFLGCCNAMLLPYVGPIKPRNLDFFGAANAAKAFSVSFMLQYDEVLDFSDGAGAAGPLEYISFPAGKIAEAAEPQGE